LLANLLAFAVSAAQQQAIWNTRMGWVTAGMYLVFVLGYAYLVVKATTARHAAQRA
jgi:predicted Na+-dependent transporter